MKKADPTTYESCRRCEEYFGGLTAIRGVLRTQEGKGIRIDLSDTETAIVSPTRLWQYYFERQEEEAKTAERYRRREVAGIVLATALLTALLSDWLPSLIGVFFNQ